MGDHADDMECASELDPARRGISWDCDADSAEAELERRVAELEHRVAELETSRRRGS